MIICFKQVTNKTQQTNDFMFGCKNKTNLFKNMSFLILLYGFC